MKKSWPWNTIMNLGKLGHFLDILDMDLIRLKKGICLSRKNILDPLNETNMTWCRPSHIPQIQIDDWALFKKEIHWQRGIQKLLWRLIHLFHTYAQTLCCQASSCILPLKIAWMLFWIIWYFKSFLFQRCSYESWIQSM